MPTLLTLGARAVAPLAPLALLAVAARHGGAQSAPPPTIDACYVPASGTVYRIDTPASPSPGAPKQCLSATHVAFGWNRAGPAGPQGARGAIGPTGPTGPAGPGISAANFAVRRFPFTASGASDVNIVQRCNAGEVLLSASVSGAETGGFTTLDIGYMGVVLLGDGPGDSGPPRRARITVNNHGLIAHPMIVSLSCYLPPS